MDLEHIRNEINRIDTEIIRLLGERFKFIPEIAAFKLEHNLPVFQPEREKQQHTKYWNLAREHDLDPELVRRVFDIIIGEMRSIQESSMRDA